MDKILYSASFDNVASAAAVDFFHMTATADSEFYLYGMTLGQTTDLGDAAEEVLRIGIYRGITGGTGGAAATEIPYLNSRAPAANTAVVTMNTTVSTAGTLMEVITWNVRVPLMWFPIPELRPRIDSSEDPLAFRLIAAPTDTITYSGTVFWAEG